MKREAAGLVLMRVFVGVWFVWAGIPKLKGGYLEEGLKGMLQYFANEGAVSFYKGFLLWAVDHARVFAYLTSVGEVVTGAALILGLMTPVAAVAVIVMCLNYFLATKNLGPAPVGLNLLCVVVAISLIVGRAGRYLGLDALICKGKKEE